ncbi:hypothetical protein KL905_003964 [Ogataea polymorpha]|nr:hypothetical protein KL937_003938 [Ogataea polymorpha]KAG7918953.1 hypothetical protein KL905_003964 [Ogataea polymorpha]KAG7933064.1 hypothetical protein KL904_004120 [Ogataea polymorpha]
MSLEQVAARISGQQDGAEVPKSAGCDKLQYQRAYLQARSAQRQHDQRAAKTVPWGYAEQHRQNNKSTRV